MKHLLKFVAIVSGLVLMVSGAMATPIGAWTTAARLHRGVNVLGYDPLWKDARDARFKPRHFKINRDGGFDFIRVVLQSFDHMDAHDQLDPRWLAKLDRVVKQATDAGLSVIIDEHDFETCSKDPVSCEPRLIAFWQQIGQRYRDAPETVLFELLNEPHAELDAEHWNTLIARLIPVIRATNPARTLVIGPTQWNSLSQLPTLRLPDDDRNILVTVHYYDPFRFTHQGANWVPEFKALHGILFTSEDEVKIGRDFDIVAGWSKANDRPVLLGEFGV